MKFSRFQQQSRTFFGLVEGDQVTEIDGSPFSSYKPTAKRYCCPPSKP